MSLEKTTLAKVERAPQTLRDIVQDRMRAAIIEGHFAPGERLVERPLCDQLGVSRTVIRETIRYLEAEGLVEVIAHQGPIVATLNWDQARQIYDIRRQLESSAAMVCAQCHDADFADRLSAALARLEASTGKDEWTELLQATTAFYEMIFRQAGHDVAWEIVQRLNGRISRLRALTLSARDRDVPGINHMTAICHAILGKDVAATQQAVERHLDDASAIAQRLLMLETERNAKDV